MGSPLCKVKTKQPMLCAHLFVLNQTVFANPVPNPRTVHCLDLHYTFSLSLNWLLSIQNWTLNTYKVAALLTQGHRVKTVLLQPMRLWHIKRNIRHGLPLKSHWTQYQIHKPVCATGSIANNDNQTQTAIFNWQTKFETIPPYMPRFGLKKKFNKTSRSKTIL